MCVCVRLGRMPGLNPSIPGGGHSVIKERESYQVGQEDRGREKTQTDR